MILPNAHIKILTPHYKDKKSTKTTINVCKQTTQGYFLKLVQGTEEKNLSLTLHLTVKIKCFPHKRAAQGNPLAPFIPNIALELQTIQQTRNKRPKLQRKK